MPEFLPFTGSRYDRTKVRLDRVTAPPYDVISDEYRDALYARDEHNIVRVDLSREDDPYATATALWNAWHREEIVRKDDGDSFYVYYQTFTTPDGRQVRREGVIGKLRVSPYEEHKVLPHERTLYAPKLDRLRLMEATNGNLSSIFGLISDPSFVFDQTLELATVHPAIADVDEFLPSGETVRHVMWRLSDPLACERISKIVARDQVIIADGHHRYETALEFHARHPETAEGEYIMIFIANLQAEGAVILPTHRLVHGLMNFDQYDLLHRLRASFELYPFDSREEALELLSRETRAVTMIELAEAPHFVIVLDTKAPPRTPSGADISAMKLQEEILKPMLGITQEQIDAKTHILYPHTLYEVDEIRESRSIDAAFILKAVKPSEIEAVVKRGEFMPQKSTFFYPKLLTGLVFHEF